MVWSLVSPQRFADFADDWQRFNEQRGNQHPLLDRRFVEPLIDYFCHAGVSLAISRQAGRINAMGFVEHAGQGVWQTFCPSQAPIAPMVRAMGTDPGPMIQEIFNALPGGSWLFGVTRQDPDYPFAPQAMAQNADVGVYGETMAVAVNGAFTDYWQSRKKNLRKNLSRYFNRLQREGLSARLEVLRAPEGMAEAVAAYGALETKGWKGAAGTAISGSNVQGWFYTDVLRRSAACGEAAVYHLWLGERLAASRLTIRRNGMLVILKTAYDEELGHYAPGRLLLYKVLEAQFADEQVDRVEFYTNATKEQLDWATSHRPMYYLNCYRFSSLKWATNSWRRARSWWTGRRASTGAIKSA